MLLSSVFFAVFLTLYIFYDLRPSRGIDVIISGDRVSLYMKLSSSYPSVNHKLVSTPVQPTSQSWISLVLENLGVSTFLNKFSFLFISGGSVLRPHLRIFGRKFKFLPEKWPFCCLTLCAENFWSWAKSLRTPRDDSMDIWSSLWKVALTWSLKMPSSIPMWCSVWIRSALTIHELSQSCHEWCQQPFLTTWDLLSYIL